MWMPRLSTWWISESTKPADQRDGHAVSRQLAIQGLASARTENCSSSRPSCRESDVAGDAAEDHEAAVGVLEVVESA